MLFTNGWVLYASAGQGREYRDVERCEGECFQDSGLVFGLRRPGERFDEVHGKILSVGTAEK
jgi:hypothetical protein